MSVDASLAMVSTDKEFKAFELDFSKYATDFFFP